MKQQNTALARACAVTLLMLLLVGLTSQPGCCHQEAGEAETASANSTNEPETDTAEAARSWVSTL